MYTLYPIYSNGFGATYLLTDNSSYDTEARRIQLVMGEIALIIDLLEIETLLKVIDSSIKVAIVKTVKKTVFLNKLNAILSFLNWFLKLIKKTFVF
jgi:hypothetical protein